MSEVVLLKPELVRELLKSGQALVVDVRDPDEFGYEKIEGSCSIPLSQLSVQAIETCNGEAKKLILLCQSGHRSAMGCERLIKDGLELEVCHLEGGMANWKQSGLPTVRAERQILPLQRQVHLAIGVMILSGLAIGYLVHPLGFLLPLMAGLGLTNAGLTGWCGLALAMAKMPWNRSAN